MIARVGISTIDTIKKPIVKTAPKPKPADGRKLRANISIRPASVVPTVLRIAKLV